MEKSTQEQAVRLPDLMTLDEVCATLRVSRATVYRLARSGELPSLRLKRTLRFDRADIGAHLRAARRTLKRSPYARSTAG